MTDDTPRARAHEAAQDLVYRYDNACVAGVPQKKLLIGEITKAFLAQRKEERAAVWEKAQAFLRIKFPNQIGIDAADALAAKAREEAP